MRSDTTPGPTPDQIPIRTAYTLPRPTFAHSETGAIMPNDTGWQTRHVAALRSPSLSAELPLLALIAAWCAYADAHQERHAAPIGDDSYIGPCWERIGRALQDLLNADHGARLDNGTIDGLLRDIATAHGCDGDTL